MGQAVFRTPEERQAAEQTKARLDAMPLRRYEGKGGVYLPAYLHSWLRGAGEGSMSVLDLAVLAMLLLAFEHGDSPFADSEVVDGGSSSTPPSASPSSRR